MGNSPRRERSEGGFFQRGGVYRPPTEGIRILPGSIEGTFTRFMLAVPKPAKAIPPEK